MELAYALRHEVVCCCTPLPIGQWYAGLLGSK